MEAKSGQPPKERLAYKLQETYLANAQVIFLPDMSTCHFMRFDKILAAKLKSKLFDFFLTLYSCFDDLYVLDSYFKGKARMEKSST